MSGVDWNFVARRKAQLAASRAPASCFINTASGATFEPANPKFVVADIGHALGMIVRFNGHCSRFYSVAEHSVLVARIMEVEKLGDPFEGLMHDASEAYLSDVPSPFKQLLPDWQMIDKSVDSAMRKQFKLPATMTPGCKKADALALFIEAKVLVAGEGRNFRDPHNLRAEALKIGAKYPIFGHSPVCARAAWLADYKVWGPRP